jgi:transposase
VGRRFANKSAERGKARFGAKSESMDQLALDLSEDDEIAQAAEDQHAEPSPGDEDAPIQTRTKRQHSRKPLPNHLDREDEVLSPGEACDGCGGTLRQVGEDVTEEPDYIPGHFVVRRFIRPRMACTWLVKPSPKPRCPPACLPACPPV